jgi:hypothetical protein
LFLKSAPIQTNDRHHTRAFYLVEKIPLPFEWETSWYPESIWTYEEEKNLFLCRNSNTGPSIFYPTCPASCNIRPYVEESNPACITDIKIYTRGAFVYFLPGETIRITYSECVFVTLGIQHAKRLNGILLSSVTCLAVQCFSTLSHKRHDWENSP